MSATKFFPEFSNPKTYLRNYNRGCEILGVDLPYLTKEKVKEVFIAGKPLNELEAAYDNLEASIRKSSQDKERNEIALSLMKKIADEVITRSNRGEIIPPIFWHKCHRINLYFTRCESKWKRITENVLIGLIRQAGESAWRVQVKILNGKEWKMYESPRYVYGIGLNIPELTTEIILNQNDNSLWGIGYYFGKGLKWFSGEFDYKRRIFSNFRRNDYFEGVYYYPNRQGDVYYKPCDRDDYEVENEKVVRIRGIKTEFRPVILEYSENVLPVIKRYMDDVLRFNDVIPDTFSSHLRPLMYRSTSLYISDKNEILIVTDKGVTLPHPDHRTVSLSSGIYQVLEVPGRTDWRQYDDMDTD